MLCIQWERTRMNNMLNFYRRLIYPYGIWLIMFIVVPMFLIMLYAFMQFEEGTAVSFTFTLDNFRQFFDPVFINVLIKSFSLATITTVICLILGYPMAYFISKSEIKNRTNLLLLITLPMWINMLIRTYAWMTILGDNGIINSFLNFLGFESVTLLYTDLAVLIGMVYNFLPFMILPIYTALTKIDASLIEASNDLGANQVQTFRRIIFPLTLPGIVSGIIMVFMPALSTFVIPRLLGGGQYILMGNLIETQFITIGNWNFGSAISLIMVALILLSMIILSKFDKDMAEGGSRLW